MAWKAWKAHRGSQRLMVQMVRLSRLLVSDGKLKIEGPNLLNINEFRLSKQSIQR